MKKIYLLLVSIFILGSSQSNAQCNADFTYSVSNTNLVSFSNAISSVSN